MEGPRAPIAPRCPPRGRRTAQPPGRAPEPGLAAEPLRRAARPPPTTRGRVAQKSTQLPHGVSQKHHETAPTLPSRSCAPASGHDPGQPFRPRRLRLQGPSIAELPGHVVTPSPPPSRPRVPLLLTSACATDAGLRNCAPGLRRSACEPRAKTVRGQGGECEAALRPVDLGERGQRQHERLDTSAAMALRL